MRKRKISIFLIWLNLGDFLWMTGLFFMFFSVIVSKSVKECPAKAVALEFDPQKTQKASCFARRNSVARASSVAPELPRGEPPAPPLAFPPDGWGAVGTGAAGCS